MVLICEIFKGVVLVWLCDVI